MIRRHVRLSDEKLNNFFSSFVPYTKFLVSIGIFLTILLLLAFAGQQLYFIALDLWQGDTGRNFVRDMTLIVVIVKAYRLLIFYLETMHVSIRYILEISIVAPALEIIFITEHQNVWVTLILAAYSMASLILYLLYYPKLNEIDREVLGVRRRDKDHDDMPAEIGAVREGEQVGMPPSHKILDL